MAWQPSIALANSNPSGLYLALLLKPLKLLALEQISITDEKMHKPRLFHVSLQLPACSAPLLEFPQQFGHGHPNLPCANHL
eukprot:Gb_32305 [translate_table: standard]